MKNTLLTVLVVLAAVFPFFALGSKIAAVESSTAVAVFAGIVLVLLAGLFFGSRIHLADADASDAAPAAAGGSAAPIAWSWDGVDRQPEGEDAEARH